MPGGMIILLLLLSVSMPENIAPLAQKQAFSSVIEMHIIHLTEIFIISLFETIGNLFDCHRYAALYHT